MEAKQKTGTLLRSSQLYGAMFVSQLLMILTLNTVLSGGGRMQDFIPAALLTFVGNFIFILPAAFLFKKYPGKNVLDIADLLLGKGASVVRLLYGTYFVFLAAYYLSLFQLFLANVMDPRQSLAGVAAAVMGVAVYSALRGIEAVVRAAAIVGAFTVLGCVILLFILFPRFEEVEFLPFFEEGMQPIFTGALLILGRTGSFVLWGFLAPYTSGKKGKGYLAWNFAIYIFTTLILAAAIGALGANLDAWLFPIYSASAFAQTGLLQSMDTLFIAMWVFGLLAKLSMNLITLQMSFQGRKRRKKWPVFCAAAAASALALLICQFVELQQLFFGLWLLLPATGITAVGIPLFLLLVSGWKGRKRGVTYEETHSGSSS